MARIDVYLSKENKEIISKFAKETGLNNSNYLCRLVAEDIKKKEKGKSENNELCSEIKSLKDTQSELINEIREVLKKIGD